MAKEDSLFYRFHSTQGIVQVHFHPVMPPPGNMCTPLFSPSPQKSHSWLLVLWPELVTVPPICKGGWNKEARGHLVAVSHSPIGVSSFKPITSCQGKYYYDFNLWARRLKHRDVRELLVQGQPETRARSARRPAGCVLLRFLLPLG